MDTPPSGTVTMLFTDIEGSTQLLARLGAERYAAVLARHRVIIRSAIEAHDGYEVGTEGDSFFVTFASADGAIATAAAAQAGLYAEPWPDGVAVRVRMGIHTGEPIVVDGNYVGIDVHRAARIMSAGHGGQVLVSGEARALGTTATHVGLHDLGAHWLKDLPEQVRLYQLVIPGAPDAFPPVRSLYRTNLPTTAGTLLGRDAELARIDALVRAGARLVTLTGPGGTGKTRLAIEAGASLAAEAPDGVFFVQLAALRDPDAVAPTIAETLGLHRDDDPAAWLDSRRTLLILDNLEQLADVGRVVRRFLGGRTVVLATSRSPLRLSDEHEVPVAPLENDAAVALFVRRAAASGRRLEPDREIAAICARLDNLPLAVELAAARTRLLAPSALLARLDATLPILTGGAHDLPERQRTLRAAIEWSHDLLGEEARSAFRRLAVFRGSFTLDAAEAVTDAGLDAIAGLVDQSLLVPQPDGRFLMLETIREYARERLDEAGELSTLALRHGRYFLGQLEAIAPVQHTARGLGVLGWVRAEEENLGTMLDRLAELAPVEAVHGAWLMTRFYLRLGATAEAASRLRSLLALDSIGDAERAKLLTRLAGVDIRLGDPEAAQRSAERAVALAEAVGDRDVLVDALSWLASLAAFRGDGEEAVALGMRALAEAETLDPETYGHALMDLGSLLGEAGRTDEARATLARAAAGARATGHLTWEMYAMGNLAYIELDDRRFEAALAAAERTLEVNAEVGDAWQRAYALMARGLALIGLGRRSDARRSLHERLEGLLAAREVQAGEAKVAMRGLALAADPRDARHAARLLGASSDVTGSHPDLDRITTALKPEFERPLVEALGADGWAAAEADGRELSFDEAVELARSLASSVPVSR